jgi:hypothetical protein
MARLKITPLRANNVLCCTKCSFPRYINFVACIHKIFLANFAKIGILYRFTVYHSIRVSKTTTLGADFYVLNSTVVISRVDNFSTKVIL